MKFSTKQLLVVIQVISWIIFVGVCIEAGGFLFNTIYTFFFNQNEARMYWSNVDLSALFRSDKGQFLTITTLMTIAAILKAVLFYIIIKVLHNQKLDLSEPFKPGIGQSIFNMSYVSFGIGLFANWGTRYTDWLEQQGINMPEIQYMGLAGADVWLFMGVVLFVIALIFKRGIEIQTENDLTV